MTGRITTHVLDMTAGGPAIGMTIELWYLGDPALPLAEPVLLGTFMTNGEGRVDQPLLEGEAVRKGNYELLFAAGDYFRRKKHRSAGTASLFDHIPIRFHILDEESHYHVPLLAAPGGYSTYRGT